MFSSDPEQKSDDEIRMVFRPVKRDESSPLPLEPKEVAERLKSKQRTVHVFIDGPDTSFDIDKLVSWLSTQLGSTFHFEIQGNITSYARSKDPNLDEFIRQLAASSFASFRSSHWHNTPASQELREKYERGYLQESNKDYSDYAQSTGIADPKHRGPTRAPEAVNHDLYDLQKLANAYQNVVRDLLRTNPQEHHSVLVVTGRGLGNEEHGGVHLRAAVQSGGVAVISTSGLINAPGMPLEAQDIISSDFFESEDPDRLQIYRDYIKKHGLSAQTKRGGVKLAFSDLMLTEHDPRITDCAQGLALSMIFFSHGETFGKVARCGTTNLYLGKPDTSRSPCRLFDAHWQEELLHHQGGDHFCDFHQELLNELQTTIPNFPANPNS